MQSLHLALFRTILHSKSLPQNELLAFVHTHRDNQQKLNAQNFQPPKIGIVCESGLYGLSQTITNTITVEYKAIPGFPSSTGVKGHKGEVVFGLLDGIPSMCFRGRFHSYEGYDMNTVALPARVMRCLGVKLMIITNAAGGINEDYNVGDIVSVQDSFALPMLAGKNLLVGHNDAELGPRYPPAGNAFDPKLQDDVLKSAKKLDMSSFVRENGTYCFVSGPMYESKAECKLLRRIGGDCVGMSTVPEIVAAHHSGLKVICLSLITNKVVVSGDEGPPASHEEVLEAVPTRSVQIQGLVKDIVKSLNEDGVLDAMPDLACIDLEAYSVDRVKKLRKMCSCPYTLVTDIGNRGIN
eukprot:scaffold891_cov274-Chaetoceros_neogracile.AAC.2